MPARDARVLFFRHSASAAFEPEQRRRVMAVGLYSDRSVPMPTALMTAAARAGEPGRNMAQQISRISITDMRRADERQAAGYVGCEFARHSAASPIRGRNVKRLRVFINSVEARRLWSVAHAAQ